MGIFSCLTFRWRNWEAICAWVKRRSPGCPNELCSLLAKPRCGFRVYKTCQNKVGWPTTSVPRMCLHELAGSCFQLGASPPSGRGAKSMNSEQGLGDESCWSISVLVFPFWSLLERSQLYDGLQASSCVGSNLGTKNAYFYVSSCYQVCVVLAGHRSSSFTCLTPTAFPAACRNQRSSSKAEIRLVAIKNIKGGNFKEIYLWCG